ncbi:MAG TPA: calcium-binding protein [Chroococcidiopsis sp.]
MDPLQSAQAAGRVRSAQQLSASSSNTRTVQTRSGSSGDDVLRGGSLSDRISGLGGSDRLLGGGGNDNIKGGLGNDRLEGGLGNDTLKGEAGNDNLLGGAGSDVLVGGAGNDSLAGNGDRDRLITGAGRDVVVIGPGTGGATLTSADVVTDFANGQDAIQLAGQLTFSQLNFIEGSGSQAGNTIIQNRDTGEYLLILQGVRRDLVDAGDFISGAASTNAIAPSSIVSTTAKFSPSSSEAAIAATGAARVKIGTQTIYIGTQQVSSINQNPIIASFDTSNSSKRWVKTNYEVTGADGRGYGLFWSGKALYAVFSVDGTQGTPSQDFRRVSSGATQTWLRSYGAGGGPKVAVLAKIDPATGNMTSAVYVSAVLSSGKSNSLAVTKLSVDSAGNLVVNANSYFSPRRIDGRAMTKTGTGNSPFPYTLVLTPDLKKALRSSAVGWA